MAEVAVIGGSADEPEVAVVWIDAEHLRAALWLHRFKYVRQRGSHHKSSKPGPPTVTVTVPMHRQRLAIGASRSIYRQASLTPADF